MNTYIDAEETLSDVASKPLQSLAGVVELLAAVRTAQSAWRTAQSFIARFGNSGDTVLAQFSAPLAQSYGAMSSLYGRKVVLVEAMVKTPNINMGDVAIEMSKLRSQSDQVWRAIAIATTEATYALADLSREDAQGHTAVYLKLTREEKTELANRLKTLAGPSPEDTKLDDSPSRNPARIPAVVLWRWLGEGWHGSDEK